MGDYILEKANAMSADRQRQSGAEIEVTEEMVKAGIYSLREALLMGDFNDLVRSVYFAMEMERRDQRFVSSKASLTISSM